MKSESSTGHLLERVRWGNPEERRAALGRLYEKFHDPVVRKARLMLTGRGVKGSGEAIATDVFMKLGDRLSKGALTVEDRGSLMGLLNRMTYQAAIDALRKDKHAAKDEAALRGPDDSSWCDGFDRVESPELPPDLIVSSREVIARFFERNLDVGNPSKSDLYREITRRKLEGDSQTEIALALGCSNSTVSRGVQVIQALLEEAVR